MGMNENYQSPMTSTSGKKSWLGPIIVLVVIIVLFVAYYVFYYGYTPAPSDGTTGGISADDTAAIGQDLQSITVEGLGSELDDIEKELGK